MREALEVIQKALHSCEYPCPGGHRFDGMRGDRAHSCDLAGAWLVLARVHGARGDARARELAARAVESLRATVDPTSPELREAVGFVDSLPR